MLWLPVFAPVLLSLVSFIGYQHIVKVVALVHGPDLHCNRPNVAQIPQGLFVLKVVGIGNLPWLPNTLQISH